MKLLINLIAILLISTFTCFSQCLTNIGFESGTFTGWEAYAGKVRTDGSLDLSLTGPMNNRHTIQSATTYPTMDPWGDFPTLCPNGGKYSVKLGNDQAQQGAERLTYEFVVPAGNTFSLIFNYALVLQNPSSAHLPFEQPRFRVNVFDLTDNKTLDCPAFDFISSSNLPGFKASKVSSNAGTVYYKGWSSSTINLNGYAGKRIRLEFTTNDCTKNNGSHFGYAYIDLDENCGSTVTGNSYCAGQTSMTLHAPPGFDNYVWRDAQNNIVGNSEALTLTPCPPDQTKYSVTIVPYEGLGCPDVFNTVVNKIDAPFVMKVASVVRGCPGTGVDLTRSNVTAGSDPDIKYSYFTDPVTLDFLYTPNAVKQEGTYYIQGVNAEGCMNILPVKVVIGDPVIKVTTPSPVQYPDAVDLEQTFTPELNVNYSYYTNPEATISSSSKVNESGTYYIKGVNEAGCTTVVPVTITITPPDPFKVLCPNTFTPNNDGINDYFKFELEGYVTFNSLTIYDRNGQIVYSTQSQQDYWDGTYKGKAAPAGVYYWVFQGTDTYAHKKIERAASITLIK
ncbi:gliding motility-associated C-terminal domain-containing protein [Mucilaginibacter sp. RS28]|uniref:Gliding motility-associated C-terminal domain-containing protein n=1 Tax=Mucilaginibacter straminoryzae TaxID=2932774 RepID=A0A9X1X8G9_9SPHI|nr:gliding motility-associated C-terminal domain-containing protein [Mucilaginibacter straminoryzae]MCJ8211633.1 gliding motility-associated C-terminal domain-containing protein [Mucilaginibacter straminoryzae]